MTSSIFTKSTFCLSLQNNQQLILWKSKKQRWNKTKCINLTPHWSSRKFKIIKKPLDQINKNAPLPSPRGVPRAAGMPENDHVWEDRGGAFCRWSNEILIFSRFPGLFGNDILQFFVYVSNWFCIFLFVEFHVILEPRGLIEFVQKVDVKKN